MAAIPGARGFATLFCAGRAVASIEVKWGEAGALVGPGFAGNQVIAAIAADSRKSCRVKLDFFRGRAPVLASVAPLFAVSLVPGYDGIGLDFGGREVLVLPDELMAERLLAGNQPLPALDFEAGLDVRATLRLLASRAGADAAAWRRTPHHLFRFRVESIVEPASAVASPGAASSAASRNAASAVAFPDPIAASQAAALPVLRGNVPGPIESAEALRDSARQGAEYLFRHLHDDGRFGYEYDTVTDEEIPADESYSLPRHAGAAWYLAQAAGAFHDARFREGAARALDFLIIHHPEGCDHEGLACVGRAGETSVDLGSAALALLAAAEYQKRTADPRFLPWARRLAAFLLSMQKPDGDFCHLYAPATATRDQHTRLLYYSGEATFALARLAEVEDPARAATLSTAADRGLAFLTGGAYDYFAGGFFYGEDHWTCLAADAAWDRLPEAHRARYADFCEGFARFLDRTRFHAADGPAREQPDLAGSYGFTGLIVPHPTPVGSRSEAMVSVYHLATRRGHPEAAKLAAEMVRDGMQFLLAHQIRPDGAWLMPDPAAARGGFLMNDVARYVRIDFVQHACSGMLRAAEVPELASAPAQP